MFAHKPLQSAHLAFPVCSLTHLAHTRSASPCICLFVCLRLSLFALSASAVLSFFFKVSQKKTTRVLDVSPLILFLSKQQVNRSNLGYILQIVPFVGITCGGFNGPLHKEYLFYLDLV